MPKLLEVGGFNQLFGTDRLHLRACQVTHTRSCTMDEREDFSNIPTRTQNRTYVYVAPLPCRMPEVTR